MSRSSKPGQFNRARDTLSTDSNPSRSQKRRAKQIGIDTGPNFFVPSFGVRRPVIITEEVSEFLKDLKKGLPKNYKVKKPDSLALTILEQRFLISKFHSIDEQPAVEAVQHVADTVKRKLNDSLTGGGSSVPRKLKLPLGRVSAFGARGNPTKIAVEPLGWKGFNARYADRGSIETRGTPREILPMPIIVREVDLCVGAIENGFPEYDDYPAFGRVNPYNRTPHISLAEKKKGGSISASEASAIAGIVFELLPEAGEIELFDPILTTAIGRNPQDRSNTTVRSPRAENVSLLPILQ